MNHVRNHLSFNSIRHHIVLILLHRKRRRTHRIIIITALAESAHIILTVLLLKLHRRTVSLALNIVKRHLIPGLQPLYGNSASILTHNLFNTRAGGRTIFQHGDPVCPRKRPLIPGVKSNAVGIRLGRPFLILPVSRQARHAGRLK